MKPADIVRFTSKIDKSRGACGCWTWAANISPNGYGSFWLNGKNEGAHKIAYTMAFSATRKMVLHTCDTPRCCNPLHLVDGTHQQNMAHRKERGRHMHCGRRGAEHHHTTLSREDVLAIRSDTRFQHVIAAAYGIGQSAVSRIKTGVRRKHD
ncbi:hypothetical protein UFOVP1413_32 [uncultured Caudovirales phage]|uniref:HNH nuclease n=1 Tax=uncultured Caudovirales phage TaxID=2100421 RepID=A0A6J5PCK2_9CAUD|nr:hypothetical protein UFOVP893_6 [uncultured Caudovirales phage]CAB4210603.1 hypothetical protein UFOVP1413_32 [uncultured Caudovirales phage]